MVAGGAAGAVYWLTVYPADIIKSKMQVDSYLHPTYKGTLDCARQVPFTQAGKGHKATLHT